MYSASKKTRAINSFKRTAVISPRDLYARYGLRINPKAIHSTDGTTSTAVVPEGSAVIQQMITGQEELRHATQHGDDLPP